MSEWVNYVKMFAEKKIPYKQALKDASPTTTR